MRIHPRRAAAGLGGVLLAGLVGLPAGPAQAVPDPRAAAGTATPAPDATGSCGPTALAVPAPRAAAGTVGCLTRLPAPPAAARRDVTPSALPAVCASPTPRKERLQGCVKEGFIYTVRHLPEGNVVGTAELHTAHYNTLKFNDRAWTHILDLTLRNPTGVLVAQGVYAQPHLACDANCTTNGFTLARRLPPNETVSISYDVSSPGTATVKTVQTFTVQLSSPPPPPILPSPPASVTLDKLTNLRCDSNPIINSTPRGGCVYSDTEPRHELSLSDPNVDEVAAHIQQAQQNSQHRWGLEPSGTRLKRLTDNAKVTMNRQVACPSFVPRPPGKSCDEYPFASTYQGAAMEGANDFSVRTVDLNDNSRAGSKLGQDYRRFRVLDGDAFWVRIKP